MYQRTHFRAVVAAPSHALSVAMSLAFSLTASGCIDTSVPDLSGSVAVDHPSIHARPAPECRKYDTPCDDHNHCTFDDRCTASMECVGVWLSCDDGQACTAERCHPATGDCHVDDSACACGDALDCDDGDPCTEDFCESETWSCVNEQTSAACMTFP